MYLSEVILLRSKKLALGNSLHAKHMLVFPFSKFYFTLHDITFSVKTEISSAFIGSSLKLPIVLLFKFLQHFRGGCLGNPSTKSWIIPDSGYSDDPEWIFISFCHLRFAKAKDGTSQGISDYSLDMSQLMILTVHCRWIGNPQGLKCMYLMQCSWHLADPSKERWSFQSKWVQVSTVIMVPDITPSSSPIV